MDELKEALERMEEERDYYLQVDAQFPRQRDETEVRIVSEALRDYAGAFHKAVYIAKKMGGPNG